MRIVLLRHGETDRNTTGRFQGQADIPLNDAGVRQAQQSARQLRPGGWSAVYSSPLARAAQTAAYAAGRLDVPHLRLAGLRERDLGVLDGQDRAEYARRQPHTMRRLLTDPGYAPPGGETGRAALSRFVTALCAVAEPEARTVLAVTHGGVLNLLMSALTRAGGSPGAMVGTCAAACVDIDWTPAGRPRAALRLWNAAAHLCAEVPAATPALPYVDLDPLVSDAVNPMEVTPT
ncbi:histidine phosphatase family protein [Streptomyces sp. NPDC005047]